MRAHPFLFSLRYSNRARRLCAVVQLAFFLPACSTWRTQPVAPRELLETQHPRTIRATMTNQSQLTMEGPEIQGDTLYGRVGDLAKDRTRTGVALVNVKHVATRETDGPKTALAVLGGAAAAFGVYVAALLVTHPWD